METNFNFKSQIATDKIQSERLLALGLKRETADMYWTKPFNEWIAIVGDGNADEDNIPAWSLGRLIEMLPSFIPISEDLPTFHNYAYLNLSKISVDYGWEDYDGEDRVLVKFYDDGFFAAVVDAIEWLIKKEHFNREYLGE